VVAILMIFAQGPTAVWRYTPIGAGRARLPRQNRNALREWENSFRQTIAWEADGRESSVALSDSEGYAFLINGKSDGHARGDAGTQVMGGLIGSLFVTNLRTAMVIGLGTGSTGGWLAAIPSIDRVDVVELEPAIVHVAQACTAVNAGAMKNPKLHLSFGDAREVLVTSREKYDLIFSEPSNPFRAGIASLFTNDFYRAVSRRLKPRGVFIQWVQAYEIDSRSIRTIYATIGDVFPHVQTWQTLPGDLILVASLSPVEFDADELRERIAKPPIRSALMNVWRLTDLEGLLSHFVARDSFATRVSRSGAPHSSDDHNFIEFGFARGVGRDAAFDASELWKSSASAGENMPFFQRGTINSESVRRQRILQTANDGLPSFPITPTADEALLGRVAEAYAAEDFKLALNRWSGLHRSPANLLELSMVADLLSSEGLDAAEPYIQNLRMFQPAEADAMTAQLRWKQRRFAEAGDAITKALVRYRTDPWPDVKIMTRALKTAFNIASGDPAEARRIFGALDEPYAVHMLNASRHLALLSVAELVDRKQCGDATMEALSQFEPHVPWQKRLLLTRARCYGIRRSPFANRAFAELEAFSAEEPESFGSRVSSVVVAPGK
ncbi:MAG TPA: fused MFS/spermidine synthase, partial [Thermoanaerobaculia bacterium]|nr:fused MFS/spermidine synthase [Thermoanaerobaculia bacterium]